jgi:hypothetical protein
MYDDDDLDADLGDDDDVDEYIEQIREESEAKGEAKGLRRAVMSAVKLRFPALVELAQEKVNRFDSPDVLDLLLREMVMVPDEAIARLLLNAVGNS